MAALDQFFVSLGVKGQDVVLKNIDKIKKEAGGLKKVKAIMDFGKKGLAGLGYIGKKALAVPFAKTQTPEEKKEDKEKNKATRQFSRGAEKIGGAAVSMANAATSFDPMNVVKAASSALGQSLSGITIAGFGLGDLPKGLAEISNATLDMATGAVNMARKVSAEQFDLSRRDTTVKFYGGDMSKAAGAGIANTEYAQLIMKASSNFGKLKEPMLKLVEGLAKTKDTEALGRVMSGDFQSTGTDKGWMFQQMANSLGDLPPSIKQQILKPMIESFSGEIQGRAGQKGQAETAEFQRKEEAQIANLFNEFQNKSKTVMQMVENMNALQVKMFDVGVGFASEIGKATTAISELPETIRKAKQSITNVANEAPSFLRNLLPGVK